MKANSNADPAAAYKVEREAQEGLERKSYPRADWL
jgi:hypothetical protein